MKPEFKLWRELAILSGLGIEVGASVGIGAGLGYWLDQKFNTHPWLLLIFTFFGVAAGIKAVLRELRRHQARGEGQSQEQE